MSLDSPYTRMYINHINRFNTHTYNVWEMDCAVLFHGKKKI